VTNPIGAAASAFNVAWVTAMRDLPGNPAGIHVESAGAATLLASEHSRDLDFVNSVHGLGVADVGAVTARYRALGLRGWCEVAPGPGAEELVATLSGAGWAQVGFHCSLRGPAVARAAAGGVPVEVVGEDGAAEFARVLAAGHEIPQEHRPVAEAAYARWIGLTGLTAFAARLDGQVAGAGALAVGGGLGYLANAATPPEWRRRGVQTALIAARIDAAARAGCEEVIALAEYGSPSQRNLERAGLQVAYTQAVWHMVG
jgi:GNAT superfamily N-acetyltransferase